MSVEFEVVPDPGKACSALLVGAAANAGQIVLAGGSTPRAAYAEFVDAVRTVKLDLRQVTFWFGDERCVAPDDGRSNYRMVKETLLDRLDGTTGVPTVHRIEGELGPLAGADAYEQALQDAGPPHFDVLLIGIGGDGHTLSLFPDQPTLSERSRLVVGVEQAELEPFVPRVSLTLPGVALARRVVVLASGPSKADAIAAAFGPDAKPDPHVPSSLLPRFANEITVLIDPDAAAKL
jgi:6-phosphogluconolactonase